MVDILVIIDKIIEEHKIILTDFDSLEKVVNDAGAMLAMDKSKDNFMPGRLAPREGLLKLNEVHKKVAEGLEAHFNREETVLLDAFQQYGKEDLVSALKTLLTAHVEIRSELRILKGQVDELLAEKISRNLWEAKGYEVKTRITQVHKTMAAHAGEEQTLLHKVQMDIRDRSR